MRFPSDLVSFVLARSWLLVTIGLLLGCSEAGDNSELTAGPGNSDASGGSSSTDASGTGATAGSASGEPLPFVPLECEDNPGFSAPDSDSVSCAPPTAVKTYYGGNGHTETWDGRVFIVTRGPDPVGWRVRVFRPERLVTDEAGVPDFSQNQPFSEDVPLELDENPGQHNAHAVIPHPDYVENPYRSDAEGNASQEGSYLTYQLLLYAQNYEDNSSLYRRPARIIVQDPYTVDASVYSADMMGEPQTILVEGGDKLLAIEPTVTMDGRLIIAQGHPDNDGKIDNLIYSYNADPREVEGWTTPRYITALYSEREVELEGLPFSTRFPLAAQPLRAQSGAAFEADEPFRGAYPWISHDGTELFFMALRTFDGARRGGASVIGRWTNWGVWHIDGPINPNRIGTQETLRLFFSSPGAFTTMWSPYPEMENPVFPYTADGPAYPLFGSNSDNYSEVSFLDFMDGDYQLVLRMNELVTAASEVDPSRTPDTSGHFHEAQLEGGAAFPLEYNGVDEIVGVTGQSIYLPLGGGVRVLSPDGLTVGDSVSVEMFVRRLVNLDQDEEDRGHLLLRLSDRYELWLGEGGVPNVSVWVDGTQRSLSFQNALPVDEWSHVAFTYDAATGDLINYIDGQEVARSSEEAKGLSSGSGDLLVGPLDQTDEAVSSLEEGQAVVLIDELRVSDVPRTSREVRRAAFTCADTASVEAADGLPLGLRSSELRVSVPATADDIVELGKKLFFDPRLSASESMSCSSCHEPEFAFTDGLPTALGAGLFLSRNTPTLVNRAFGTRQFWDGRAASLQEQALIPIESEDEMNLSIDEAITRLTASDEYVALFDDLFGEAPSADSIAAALSAYQLTLLSGDSRVDRFEAGDRDALSAAEIRGRTIFRGKGRCIGCHSGSNYSDERFRNNGIVCVGDRGRASVTGREGERGQFKTPTLRSVNLTPPYMHDGSIETLEEVIEAYNRGGNFTNNVDTEIRPLELTERDKADLLAYLLALEGSAPDVTAPELPE